MFYILILCSLILVVCVSFIVVKLFSSSVDKILLRIIKEDISLEWSKYIKFSSLVVGISSGMPLNSLNKYIPEENNKVIKLTTQRLVFEIYETIINTLQGLSYSYCLFFIVALLAYIIIKRKGL